MSSIYTAYRLFFNFDQSIKPYPLDVASSAEALIRE